MIKRTLATIMVTLAAMISTLPTEAAKLKGQEQESRLLSDRFNIALGVFAPDFRTEVAAGFGSLLGTVIRLEDDLGLDSSQLAGRLDGFYRFNRKSAIDFGYLLLDRDSQATFSGDIIFEELKFSGEVRSEFRSQVFKVTYKRSLVNTGKVDVGVSAGLSLYTFKAGIGGDIIIDDPGGGPPTMGSGEAGVSISAPVPAFGFYLGYAIQPKLIFRAGSEFLGIQTGDLDIRLVDVKATLDWYFTRHFGMGLGWNSTTISYKDAGNNPLSVNYRYSGFLLFLGGVF